MARKRTSPLWVMPIDELRKVVDESESYADVLHHCGLSELTGGNYRTLKERCRVGGIDLSGLKSRSIEARSKRMFELHSAMEVPLDEVLVEHSTYRRRGVKRRLIANGMLLEVCIECGQGAEWRGKKLVLILDHINGVNDDHRIENLRLLCPNCNSQMDTFAGRNISEKSKREDRKEDLPPAVCERCGCKTSRSSVKSCRSCAKKKSRKVEWPSPEELSELMSTSNMVNIGKKYGVSDNAVRKWAKNYGLL